MQYAQGSSLSEVYFVKFYCRIIWSNTITSNLFVVVVPAISYGLWSSSVGDVHLHKKKKTINFMYSFLSQQFWQQGKSCCLIILYRFFFPSLFRLSCKLVSSWIILYFLWREALKAQSSLALRYFMVCLWKAKGKRISGKSLSKSIKNNLTSPTLP